MIEKEIIWNNSFIKNENKTFYYKKWFEKGIKYIEHIFNIRQKVFYTFQHIKTLYSLENADFLKYYRLIQSIPNAWKQKLKENRTVQENTEITLIQRLQKLKHANKFLYNKQLNDVKNKITIKPHTKWEIEFHECKLERSTHHTI